MRILKTLFASIITYTAISVLVYAVIYHFETALLIMAGIGMIIVVGVPIYHWWEKFEG